MSQEEMDKDKIRNSPYLSKKFTKEPVDECLSTIITMSLEGKSWDEIKKYISDFKFRYK